MGEKDVLCRGIYIVVSSLRKRKDTEDLICPCCCKFEFVRNLQMCPYERSCMANAIFRLLCAKIVYPDGIIEVSKAFNV